MKIWIVEAIAEDWRDGSLCKWTSKMALPGIETQDEAQAWLDENEFGYLRVRGRWDGDPSYRSNGIPEELLKIQAARLN